MTSPLAALILIVPLAFATLGVIGVRRSGCDPSTVQRAGVAASRAGVLVAASSAVAVAIAGPVQSPILGWWGLGLAVRLDPLSLVMFSMISVLAVVILRFSASYLAGEARRGEFLARLAVTIAAVELLVLSGNLATLVVAWVATSLALHRLLVFFPDRRRAQLAARKKFVAARLGDVLLLSAVVALYLRFGTGDLGEIFDRIAAGADGTAIAAAAICLAVAAMLKSAMFPTYGWLVEVMETPTPVSALLHAGILNAGPFLVMRMAFVVGASGAANTALVLVGASTAVIASLARTTQPSVKVALGYSSAAHMGFTLALCGFGLVPAALLHLVGHSFYKAHAFLSSGSVVDEFRASGVAVPARLGSPLRAAVALSSALGLYLVLANLWGVAPASDPGLVVLGAVIVLGTAKLMVGLIDSDGPWSAWVVGIALALLISNLFFALESLSHWLLYDIVPHDGSAGSRPVLLAGLVTVVFAAVVLWRMGTWGSAGRDRQTSAAAVHLRNGLYVNALFDRLVLAAWRRADAPGLPTRTEQETTC